MNRPLPSRRRQEGKVISRRPGREEKIEATLVSKRAQAYSAGVVKSVVGLIGEPALLVDI